MRTRIIKNDSGICVPVVINKADSSTDININDTLGPYVEVQSDIPIQYLKDIARESAIIPQCVRAYKTNIPGFGIEIKSKIDDKIDTTEEKAEAVKLNNIIDNLNHNMPAKKVFEDLVEYREQTGIAYLEVVRNNIGDVVEINAIDPEFIIQTTKGPVIEFNQKINGESIKRKKRFRKFKQIINGKTVWYKEFGFPYFMNYADGEITQTDNESLESNELLVFKIGNDLYGTPRWWGQSINLQGSKMAEFVNYNYFVEGRHTPVMIIVKGGTLSDKSWKDLQTYMNDIKGYKNSHGFIVLEVEAVEDGLNNVLDDKDKTKGITVEVKDLSPMLQHDALFSQYLKDNQDGVQSSFNLPDIYVGKTKDYNRATAYAAIEVTERQVFSPEREYFEWIMNKILLGGYVFKYVKAVLKSPKLSNTDDLFKILTVLGKAGGLTPRIAQSLLQKYVDIDLEEYKEPWADIPIQVLSGIRSQQKQPQQQEGQIEGVQKSERTVDIFKDVRNALEELTQKLNKDEEGEND